MCIEPPGECCQTEELNEKTLECIQDYYKKKNITVHFTEDGLYFSCEES